MELQKAPNSQNNAEKEQNWRIHTCNFKTYYTADRNINWKSFAVASKGENKYMV